MAQAGKKSTQGRPKVEQVVTGAPAKVVELAGEHRKGSGPDRPACAMNQNPLDKIVCELHQAEALLLERKVDVARAAMDDVNARLRDVSKALGQMNIHFQCYMDQFRKTLDMHPLHARSVSAAEQGNWGPLRFLLWIGSMPDGEGVRLTRAECSLLLQLLDGSRKPPRRRGHPFVPDARMRTWLIAYCSRLLELDGMSPKSAIAHMEQLCNVSRSTVTAARRKWPLSAELTPDDRAPCLSLIAACKLMLGLLERYS